ncbi:MAG: hypothetical protein AAB636_00605, partial [Patescibacteria group bacterium]
MKTKKIIVSLMIILSFLIPTTTVRACDCAFFLANGGFYLNGNYFAPGEYQGNAGFFTIGDYLASGGILTPADY